MSKAEHFLLQDLIESIEQKLASAWNEFRESEEGSMRASGDANDTDDGQSITDWPMNFDQVICTRAELLCEHSEFSMKQYEGEQLAPPNIVDWLERWKVLEAPNMSRWMAKHSNKYPRFTYYILLLEMLRTLLLRYHQNFPERASYDF